MIFLTGFSDFQYQITYYFQCLAQNSCKLNQGMFFLQNRELIQRSRE